MTQGSEGCASRVWQSLAWGDAASCVCRIPVWESLCFHLKAATMWQRTISTSSVHHVANDYQYFVNKLSAGPRARPRPAGSRLHSQTPLALKRNRFTLGRWGGGVWCFVKVLLGLLSMENSLEKSLYIFPVNKNSSNFVIFHYLKVLSCSLFWGFLFVCFL